MKIDFNKRDKQAKKNLIEIYGLNYFTKQDLKNICVQDNGDVYIGITQFKNIINSIN